MWTPTSHNQVDGCGATNPISEIIRGLLIPDKESVALVPQNQSGKKPDRNDPKLGGR